MGIELAGRDADLAALNEALEAAMAGRGRLAVISGEPGIGKTALATALAERASGLGAEVVWGRSWELGEAPPYLPLWPCLRSLGIDPIARSELPGPDEADEPRAFVLWEQVLAALTRAATARPRIWILEDLHAADLATLDLLCFLARPIRALAVLVLVTTRARDPLLGERAEQRLHRLMRDGLDLRPSPLTEPEVAFVAARWAHRSLPTQSVARLTELTGGNPLFVVECARSLARKRDDHGAVDELPATVRQVVIDRVRALAPATRDALGAGAILGRNFSAGLAARSRGVLPAQIVDALLPALRAGLIVELEPGRFAFSHALVRDAIEASLAPAERTRLHAQAADVLADLGDAPDVVVERARHALAGTGAADATKTIELVDRAVRELERRSAFDRAYALGCRLDAARRAGMITPPATTEELLHLAQIAFAAGRFREGSALGEEVLARCRTERDPHTFARAALVMAYDRPGVVDPRLVATLREALERLGETDPSLRCRVLARLAAALQPAEDPRVPVDMARDAIARARAIGDETTLRAVLAVAGAALVDYAPIAERVAAAEELLALATAASDVPQILRARTRLALDFLEGGDHARFEAEVDTLLHQSIEAGHPRLRWRPLLVGSMRACMHGRFAESDRMVVEVTQLAELTDDPALAQSIAAHQLVRARGQHRDDELRHLVGVLDRSLPVTRPGILALLRAAVLARLEDVEATRAELERVRRVAPRGERDAFAFLHCEAIALAGDDDERRQVRAWLTRNPAAERHGGHVPYSYEGPGDRGIALLDASLGEPARAEQTLRACIAASESRGHVPWVAQLRYDLGRVLLGMGRLDDAVVELTSAAEIAERLPMPGLATRARAHIDRARGATAAPSAPASAADPVPTVPRQRLSMRQEGAVWRLERAGAAVHVRDSRGMQMLYRLVERPDEELHVLVLASDAEGALAETDAGAHLDAEALRAYRTRLEDLEDAIDEAETRADSGRAERLRAEREILRSEVARAVGLGGSVRKAGSATERARVNVQRRLKDAIGRVAEADPALGAYLEKAVRTGTFCSFRP